MLDQLSVKKHTHTWSHSQDPVTLQLPKASVQDGVEGDVGSAVTKPARPLHAPG